MNQASRPKNMGFLIFILVGLPIFYVLQFVFLKFYFVRRPPFKMEPVPPVKWGFIDKAGKLVIPPRFDNIGQSAKQDWRKVFSEGLCAAKFGGKWGYIDHSGQWQIKPRFDIANAFSEGLAYVFDGTTYGYINPKGEMVINLNRESLGAQPGVFGELLVGFSNGRAVIRENKLYGYIDHSGKTVIKPQFSYAGQFSEGLAEAQSPSKLCGFINTDGKFAIPPYYRGVSSFHDGLAVIEIAGPVRRKRDVFVSNAVIDKSGKLVFDCSGRMLSTSHFSEGLLTVEVYSWMWKHIAPGVHSLNNPGVVDRQGKILFEAPYAPCTSFYKEGLASANAKADSNDVLMGFIDRNGKWIIKPQFDSAHDFSEGLAAVGKYRKGGYIDKSGKYVIQPGYYANPMRGDIHPQPFCEGLAAVPVLDLNAAKTNETH